MRSWLRVVVLGSVVAMAIGVPAPTSALVVQGPVIADPLNYVGWWRGATGVAIGPHTIISAKHLGGTPGQGFMMDGTTYTSTSITYHPTADIALIRIAEELPGWHALAPQIRKGDTVLLAGLGRYTSSMTSQGAVWSGVGEERWGRNKIDKVKKGVITINFTKGRAALPGEAMFTLGDSGAGLFIDAGFGGLQLAGVAFGAQGNGSTKYGSKGYATDVVALAPWINSVIATH